MPLTSTLNILRKRITSIELDSSGNARPWAHKHPGERGNGQPSPAFSFGHAALNSRFSHGGLPFGVHQMAGAPGESAAALLFALLVAARRLKADPTAQVLVVQEEGALTEGGGLYGPGLYALGLDPARIALVCARDGAMALRMVDEAARSGAASVVVAELDRGARALDLAATQRLNFHSRRTATLTLLVTPDLEAASAAMTRWRVRTARSRASRRFLGPPALELELTRNRCGPVGQFSVEWSSEDEAFRTPAPLRASMVRAPLHRPSDTVGGDLFPPGAGADAGERLTAHGHR